MSAPIMATEHPQEQGNPFARIDRIYVLYRNCMLNELYYSYRLKLYSRVGFWLGIITFIGSSASGVAGWIIWTKYPAMAVLWGIIAGTSAVLAGLKPILQTDAKIRRYGSLFAGYRQLQLSMKDAVDDISEARGIPRETERDIERVRKRYRALQVDDDPTPPPKLIKRLQAEVNNRVDISSLFYPSDTSPHAGQTAPAAPSIAGDVEGVDAKIEPVEPWPSRNGRRQ